MTDIRTRLEALWLARHHEGYPPENKSDTCRLCDRFTRLLNAQAWIDAAIMCGPKHLLWAIGNMEDGPFARVLKPMPDGTYGNGYLSVEGAPSPAEALIAAIEMIGDVCAK